MQATNWVPVEDTVRIFFNEDLEDRRSYNLHAHIYLAEWLFIEQHYILIIVYLGMRNADLGTSNARKIENILLI